MCASRSVRNTSGVVANTLEPPIRCVHTLGSTLGCAVTLGNTAKGNQAGKAGEWTRLVGHWTLFCELWPTSSVAQQILFTANSNGKPTLRFPVLLYQSNGLNLPRTCPNPVLPWTSLQRRAVVGSVSQCRSASFVLAGRALRQPHSNAACVSSKWHRRWHLGIDSLSATFYCAPTSTLPPGPRSLARKHRLHSGFRKGARW